MERSHEGSRSARLVWRRCLRGGGGTVEGVHRGGSAALALEAPCTALLSGDETSHEGSGRRFVCMIGVDMFRVKC